MQIVGSGSKKYRFSEIVTIIVTMAASKAVTQSKKTWEVIRKWTIH